MWSVRGGLKQKPYCKFLINGWLLTSGQLYMSHYPHKMEHQNMASCKIFQSIPRNMAKKNIVIMWKWVSKLATITFSQLYQICFNIVFYFHMVQPLGLEQNVSFWIFMFQWGLWLSCLQIFNRLHVSSLGFYVKAMFQKYGHVSCCGIRLCMKAMF